LILGFWQISSHARKECIIEEFKARLKVALWNRGKAIRGIVQVPWPIYFSPTPRSPWTTTTFTRSLRFVVSFSRHAERWVSGLAPKLEMQTPWTAAAKPGRPAGLARLCSFDKLYVE
jgi:hypothetical protein